MTDRVQRIRAKKEKSILDTATRLFKRSGFNRVGIDLIISESNASKMSVYKYFGSKENIIVTCLTTEIENNQNSILKDIDNVEYAHLKLKALYEWHIKKITETQYNGCLIMKATVELWHLHSAAALVKEYQNWKFKLLSDLLNEMNVIDEITRRIIFNLFNSMMLPALQYQPTWQDVQFLIDFNDRNVKTLS